MTMSEISHRDAVSAAGQRVRNANDELKASVEHRAQVLTAAHAAGLTWNQLGEWVGGPKAVTPQTVLQWAQEREVRAKKRREIALAKKAAAG